MKRVVKRPDSEILMNNIQYVQGGNNSLLSDLLWTEQKGFCAYTETFLGRTDKAEIDHFNPKQDFTGRNEYDNLFLVKAQWNNEKSSKWDNFQPIMHPTSPDFETRIIYSSGDYILADENDTEAKNLRDLLKLDDPDLAHERKSYIERKKGEMHAYGSPPEDFFKELILTNVEHIRFLRALDEEFNIDIKSMLP